MKRTGITVCVGFFFSLCYATFSFAQNSSVNPKPDASKIYESAAPSVVIITCQDTQGALSYGSGVVLRADGIIATSFHVVSKAVAASVRLNNGDVYDSVSIVDSDERKDIAILKIKAVNLPVMPVTDSDNVKIGATVYTIGSPRGLTGSLSSGLVSGIRSAGEISTELSGFRIIQFTAPVSPGSSGGALINDWGHFLGLVFAERTGGQNLNVAIPANYVVPLVTGAVGSGRLLSKIADTPKPPNPSKPTRTDDDFAYGSLSDLRGVRKIYIETGGETSYRDRIIKEIQKAKLNLQILGSEDDAECVIIFRNEMINEPWFSGSTAVVEKSRGKGMIILVGRGQNKHRLLHTFNETKDTYFEDKPIVKFAKMVVKAFQDANR